MRDTNRQFAANTVSAIGRCAVRLPAVRSACVEGLLMLAKGVLVGDGASISKEEIDQSSSQGCLRMSAKEKSSQEAGVVAQAVLALRSIVQQNPSEQEQVEDLLLLTNFFTVVTHCHYHLQKWPPGWFKVSSGSFFV